MIPRPPSPERFVVVPATSPTPTFGVCGVSLPIPLLTWRPADLNARKEAVMASVRNELALANAQELMNVRYVCFLLSL